MDVQSDSSRLETPRRFEILTGAGRRRWSPEMKAKIVAESYADDALPVAEIARRYGARGSQVHGWRKDAREGRLVLPANTGKLNFAPIVVAEPKPPAPRKPPPSDPKRNSAHENTIREYVIDKRGLTLGAPLTNFHGVLRGVPTLVGEEGALLEAAPE